MAQPGDCNARQRQPSCMHAYPPYLYLCIGRGRRQRVLHLYRALFFLGGGVLRLTLRRAFALWRRTVGSSGII